MHVAARGRPPSQSFGSHMPNAHPPTPSHDRRLAGAIAGAAIAALCFGAWRNLSPDPGEVLSSGDVVWLGLVLTLVVVVPAGLALDRRLEPAVGRVFALALACGVSRAAAELVLLRQSAFRPDVVVGFDLAIVGVVALLRHGTGGEDATVPDRSALAIATLLQATLALDAAMAVLGPDGPLTGSLPLADAGPAPLEALRWLGAMIAYPVLCFRLWRIGANDRALAALS